MYKNKATAYYTATLCVEAHPWAYERLGAVSIFTQPPYLFDACLVSSRLCLFT